MATLAFDSLKYARRLKDSGVPESQAEVQAELMAEAFGFYADNIVTRDYLDATLRAAFAEQDARLDKRFLDVESTLTSRLNQQQLPGAVRADGRDPAGGGGAGDPECAVSTHQFRPDLRGDFGRI